MIRNLTIKIDSVYKVAISSLIILPSLVSSIEINLILALFLFGLLILDFNVKYTQKVLNILSFFIVILIISLTSSFLYPNELYAAIKDFFFFIKPIIHIMLGFYFATKIKDRSFLFNIIIKFAIFLSIIHLYKVFIFLQNNEFNINLLRNYAGKGSFVTIFALALLLTKKGRELHTFKAKYLKLILAIIIISFICYFSRTSTISLILLILGINGYFSITIRGLVYMFSFFILIAALYAYLFSIDLKRNANGVDGLLYKIKNAPAEVFKTKIDVNNHAELWDHWRAYEGLKAYEQLENTKFKSGLLFGKGFGSLVDLEMVVPLNGEDVRYITTLHNGYAYIMFKSGFLGLLLYFLCLIYIYLQLYNKTDDYKVLITNNLLSTFGVMFLLSTLVVTGIYHPRNFSGVIIGALLYFSSNPIKNLNLDNNYTLSKL